MRGPIRSILLAALAVCGLAAAFVSQASAATIEDEATPLLAIYGNPGSNGAAIPVGGGLGRNYGFGKNMLFQAGNGLGTALSIVLAVGETEVAKSEAKETYLGGTLMSNKTGENNPLSFTIQFVDFQDNSITAEGKTTKVASYSDTSDRPWITEICSPAALIEKCKTDAQFTEPIKKGGVKIEDVSFNIGPGTVVQGTAWGEWINGAAKVAPCIKLTTPAAGVPTLVETQGAAVGAKAKTVTGEACLISANNDWYKVGTELQEPAITIANT
jgi:hypothetical protein